jgi:L-alanine-DL-glutamate epimerase-like enolase superfamily enzyme
MKIQNIEVFQVSWAPEDKPAQRSAWVRIHCDDGLSGIGEASPMQGGLASLGCSWLATAVGALGVPLLLWRTIVEDRTLRVELPGYGDYAQRVRWRLLPGVW